jgi:hypothetical protein
LLSIAKSIVVPIGWIVDDVIFDIPKFKIISDDMVVIIGLEKMVVPIVFRNQQAMLVNVIIYLGIDRRFESRNK